MPDTFDAVEKLWQKAEPKEKEDYLFRALTCLRAEIKSELSRICITCQERIGVCDGKYVTKKQARILLVVVLALALGIGIGGGYITFAELLKSIPKSAL